MEVFVHDQNEKFTNLNLFTSETLKIINNSETFLFIRPEIVQKLNKPGSPCIEDNGYSYSRVSGQLNTKGNAEFNIYWILDDMLNFFSSAWRTAFGRRSSLSQTSHV